MGASRAILKRLRVVAVAVLVTLLLGAGSFSPPSIDGHVTDPGGTLALVERDLEARLDRLGAQRGDEVAVLIAPSLNGASIEDAAYATFNAWRLGKLGKDNGVLLLIAPAERRIRIETGRGIGDRLPDAVAGRIIRDHIAPRMIENDVEGAVRHGLDAIEAVLAGKPVPPPRAPAASSSSPGGAAPKPGLSPRDQHVPAAPNPAPYPEWQRRKDEADTRAYEQRKRDDAQTPFVVAGLALLVAGAIWLGIYLQKRRHRGSDAWADEVAAYRKAHPEARSPTASTSSSRSSSFASRSSGGSSSRGGGSGSGFRGGGGSSGGGGASGSY